MTPLILEAYFKTLYFLAKYPSVPSMNNEIAKYINTKSRFCSYICRTASKPNTIPVVVYKWTVYPLIILEFILEINRVIQKASSQELLATGTMKNDTADDSMVGANPIILKSSEILKATTTGSDIHLVASILEMT